MPRGVKKITEIMEGEIPESPIISTETVEVEINGRELDVAKNLPILDPRDLFLTNIGRIQRAAYQLDESQRKVAENILAKATYIFSNQPQKVKEYLNELIRVADLVDNYVMYNFDNKLQSTISKFEIKLNIPKKVEELTPNL